LFLARVAIATLHCTKPPTWRLRIRSLMPENGVLFSDGVEAGRLDFNSGTEVQIGVAERQVV
jgi:hypothetical protein